ncbi:FRG domain-containing protein [Yoonia sp. R78084]|uniref:FRG domain-containing protein n=1 Tax=Yoonia sp. R78084 TaxID=3093869 RepID=UPI0037DCB2A1
MRKKYVEIQSVSQFIDLIMNDKTDGALMCYRGQSYYRWKPIPGVYRDDYVSHAEEASVRELLTDSPTNFENDQTMFEKLVRAQHYQLPTRLLDVSLNPLVALYFACSDSQEKDGKVFGFSVIKLDRILQFDSDRMSLISNLARLDFEERERIGRYLQSPERDKRGGIQTKKFKKWFNAQPEVKRLVQFVRVEKPYFLNDVRPSDLTRYFFVWPKRSHPRLIAQSGAFLAAGLLRFKALEKSTSIDVTQYSIPKDNKQNLIAELDILNINGRTLFPEIDNVSKYIRRKHQFNM